MAKIKRKTSHVEDSGFAIYDGDTPPVGAYRGKLKQLKIRDSRSSDNQYYNALVELENNDGNKAAYDRFPAWVMLTMTDKEANIRREKNLYRAIGVDEDPDVDYDNKTGEIKKIGSKSIAKILGTPVIVNMRKDDRDEVRGDEIFPAKASSESPSEPEEDEDDLIEEDEDETEDEEVEEDEEDEESEDDDWDEEERRAELKGMTLPKLKKLAESDYDMDTAGKKKPELVQEILDHENPDEDGDEEEEEEEEEDNDIYAELLAIKTVKKLRERVVELFEDDVDPDDIAEMNKSEIMEFLVEEELVEEGEAF